MSCYAELRHARTQEEYDDALRGCRSEARADEYYEKLERAEEMGLTVAEYYGLDDDELEVKDETD